MARSTSSTPDYYPEASTSAYKPAYDDIPPIPFEKESELNQVLTRLRAKIISTARAEWLKQDGDLSELERVGGAKELLETFFDELSPVIRSNCTFKGKMWEAGDAKAARKLKIDIILNLGN